MSEELQRIGVMFRQKRQDMNLSLKEVENATSIRTSYLEAIEQGSIGAHVSSIYALGFIKQYASFLGYDAERMIREHPAAFRMPSQKHEFTYGIGTLEMRGSMSGGVKWLPNLLWALAGTLALVLAYFFARAVGIL